MNPSSGMFDLDIPFRERLVPFGGSANPDAFRAFSPTGPRLEELWADGIGRFGGPFLAGANRYAALLLSMPAMKDWYAAALAETWRDEEHEIDARAMGEWLADLRAR